MIMSDLVDRDVFGYAVDKGVDVCSSFLRSKGKS